ncbi:WXG100 family type VII secretion target [Antrihabitans sp. YC2-6]|uniref:WXG100 family type VII secretion target n=1 Tax=Antrihabitans sp. YC2-6 TaxID=2799498 RepID=UPI0018F480B4|nr:hypothetical protein [Antrihabitans sp. YC2-6]MBJ8347452.1 hypothetical protein [Antrihabitans sp. YC2-6]
MSGASLGGPPEVTDKYSVAQYLERGKYGLAYFREFTALYQKLEPVGDVSAGLETRLSEQSGMDLARMQDCIDAVDAVLTEATSQIDEQTTQARSIPGAWTGAASVNARAMIDGQIQQAKEVHEQASVARDALRAAREAFRDAVEVKAEVCVGFREQDSTGVHSRLLIQGRSSAELGKLIDVWQGTPSYGELNDAAAIMYRNDDYPQTSSVGDRLAGDQRFMAIVERDCEYWALIFRTDFETKLNAFLAVCDSTDTTIKAQYATLIEALGDVSDKQFPLPSGAGVPSESGRPILGAAVEPGGGALVDTGSLLSGSAGGSGVGGMVGSVGSGAGLSSAVPASPHGVDVAPQALSTRTPADVSVPAQTSNGLGGLGGLGGLADVAAKAAELVAGVAIGVVDGAVQMIQGGTDGAEVSLPVPEGDMTEAVFDVAGQQLGCTTGAGGALVLTTTGPDGEPKQFTLTIDENGVPVVAPVGQEEEPIAPVVEEGVPPEPADEAIAIEPDQSVESWQPEAPADLLQEPMAQPVLPPVTVRPEQEGAVRQSTQTDDSGPPAESGAQVAEAGSM